MRAGPPLTNRYRLSPFSIPNSDQCVYPRSSCCGLHPRVRGRVTRHDRMTELRPISTDSLHRGATTPSSHDGDPYCRSRRPAPDIQRRSPSLDQTSHGKTYPALTICFRECDSNFEMSFRDRNRKKPWQAVGCHDTVTVGGCGRKTRLRSRAADRIAPAPPLHVRYGAWRQSQRRSSPPNAPPSPAWGI